MDDLIEEHLEYLQTEGYADQTIESAEYALGIAHKRLPDGLAATAKEIRAYLQSHTAATKRTYDAHLRRFYAWGYSIGELACDPMSSMRRPPVPDSSPKPVPPAELEAALAASAGLPDPVGDLWYVALLLAGYQGLRADEIARCRREHITEEWCRVPHGKGGRAGTVETHPAVWAYVRNLPPGHLVLWRGRPITGRWLSSRQRWHFVRRINMPQMHLHRARHTFATEMVRAGAGIEVVSQLMRHRRVETTMTYIKVAGVQRRDAIRLLSAPRMGHEPASNRLVPGDTVAA